jgi:hypothetical protein
MRSGKAGEPRQKEISFRRRTAPENESWKFLPATEKVG